MPKGISLHIGLNEYDYTAYKKKGLSIRRLPNCTNDAAAYMAIATRFRFNTSSAFDENATWAKVVDAIGLIAQHLEYSDLFFLSFSGHGYQVYDKNGDEEDHFDEAWCLYDRMLVDDDLFELLKLFRPGVRIVVVCDCCHSGTSIKGVDAVDPLETKQKLDDIQATCLLLAACQDGQTAFSGNNIEYSLYTYHILKIMEEYEFCESYRELHNRVLAKMPANSKPNLFKIGPGADQFAKKRPFNI